MAETLYTLGHSTHSLEKLLGLLRTHRVSMVADVRSHPYSRRNPQFNRKAFQQALKEAGIAYTFLGRELGARSEDDSCYVDGKVQYDRLAETELFRDGLARVLREMADHRVALMCAEKDPLVCHRTILVCRHLVERGLQTENVQHILADGRLESHREALARLREELKLPAPGRNLLGNDNPAEIEQQAYELRGKKIAYSK